MYYFPKLIFHKVFSPREIVHNMYHCQEGSCLHNSLRPSVLLSLPLSILVYNFSSNSIIAFYLFFSYLFYLSCLHTRRFIYYRKSVLHLRKRMFHVRLSRCSTYLRQYSVHPVCISYCVSVCFPVCLPLSIAVIWAVCLCLVSV